MNAEILKMKKELRIWLSIHWWMMAVESAVFLLHLSVKSEPFFKLISVFSNTIQVAQNFLSHIDLTGLQLQIAILSLGLKIVLSYMIFLVIWNLKPGHLAKKVAKIRTATCVWFWKKKLVPPLVMFITFIFIYLFFDWGFHFLSLSLSNESYSFPTKNTNIKIVFNARYSIHSLRDIFVPNNIFADQFSIKSS